MVTFKKGGIHPEENKLAKESKIENYPLPDRVVIYTAQHLGVPAVVKVNVGDHVKVGQLIAAGEAFISANVHSSVSGTVTKIEQLPDYSGYKKESITIQVEGDEWDETIDRSPEIKREITLSKQEIIDRLKDCGVVGLGGACFPTHVKYMIPPDKQVDYLLINAAECEPYITTDHRIMLENAEECMIGIEALLKVSGAPIALVGIENNKKDAIAHLTEVAQHYPNIKICPLQTKYPQGAEKQLIQALTNRRVPSGKLPIEVGVIVNNINTALVVYEAVQKNKPLIEDIVTISGKKVKQPRNYRIRLGTSIKQLLEDVGIPEGTGKIIVGGPMMGKPIAHIDSYTRKGVSSLLILDESECRRGEVSPCIRCGRCVAVCPMGLEPILLQPLVEAQRYDECERNGIMNCMECGSCQFECPANRPISDYIRLGKSKTAQFIKNRNK